MASVVFEKQLINIEKGLKALRGMNKELGKFERGSNSTKILKGVMKSLKEAESSVKSMALGARNVSFDRAYKSLNRFNSGLKNTKKYLDSIYGKLKMIGFASMAGVGSIAAMGGAMGSGAKGVVGHVTEGKLLAGMNPRSLDVVKHMGRLQGDEDIFVNMYRTLLNAANNNSVALANFGLNQSEIIKGLNDTNILVRMETLNKVMEAVGKMEGNNVNTHYNDLAHELLGVGISDVNVYRNRAGGDLKKAFEVISAKTNGLEIYNNVEAVGKSFIDLQYKISQFGDWFTSKFKGGLEKGFKGLEKAFEIVKNNKSINNYLNALSAGAEVIVPRIIGNVFETVLNIPNYLESIRILLNKIALKADSIRHAVIHSFTNLMNKLSEAEFFGGKPFSVLKPSNESLASMYGDKFADVQSALNLAEADNKNLENYLSNNISFRGLTGDNETEKELKEKINRNNELIKDLKTELSNIKAEAVINGLEIHVNMKEESIDVKQRGLVDTATNLYKSFFRK